MGSPGLRAAVLWLASIKVEISRFTMRSPEAPSTIVNFPSDRPRTAGIRGPSAEQNRRTSSPMSNRGVPETIARYGPASFLLTTSDDDRPHATHVVVSVDGAAITCELGRKTARNGVARPRVSLLWPPIEAGGYSLIVDGEIAVAGTPGEDAVGTVTATRAVLHRPAPVDDAAADAACGSDCLEIEIPDAATT